MSNVHAALRNLKVKDTPKIQNALHERRFMRGFEEKRETLTERGQLFPMLSSQHLDC